MQPCTLVMTTWITEPVRKKVVEETLATWNELLKYDGELRLCVSDDGSTLDLEPEKYWDGPITYSRQERHGVGASLNAGFREAFKTSPLVLYAVDDWCLIETLDITPWIQLLEEREDVGVVRLGPPHPFTQGRIEAFTNNWQGWGLRLDRQGMVVGQRPALWHKRMIDIYGWHQENCSAIDCERMYTENMVNKPGPDVVMALPHKWRHDDQATISLSEMEPN